jgi:hypothetical protein
MREEVGWKKMQIRLERRGWSKMGVRVGEPEADLETTRSSPSR